MAKRDPGAQDDWEDNEMENKEMTDNRRKELEQSKEARKRLSIHSQRELARLGEIGEK